MSAVSKSIPSMDEIRKIPKVELHAHLSGSIMQPFLMDLMKRKGIAVGGSGLPFDCKEDLNGALSKCFSYFKNVGQVVTTLDVLRECADHVLRYFAGDNCKYLEMRTTLKEYNDATLGRKTTKEEYVKTVLSAFQAFRQEQAEKRLPEHEQMQVKLLLSIDRGTIKSQEEAQKQVQDVADLCEKFAEDVVGVDLCGNPSNLSMQPFILPALRALHEERPDFFTRFPITCHIGETPHQESEIDDLLDNLEHLNIRRLGHAIYLTEAHRERVFDYARRHPEKRIGVELCPTSNLVCMQEADRRNHHFPLWYRRACGDDDSGSGSGSGNGAEPAAKRSKKSEAEAEAEAGAEGRNPLLISVNTDDSGLFSTSLSEELHLVAEEFGVDLAELQDLQFQAAESCFLRDKSLLLRTLKGDLSQ